MLNHTIQGIKVLNGEDGKLVAPLSSSYRCDLTDTR